MTTTNTIYFYLIVMLTFGFYLYSTVASSTTTRVSIGEFETLSAK